MWLPGELHTNEVKCKQKLGSLRPRASVTGSPAAVKGAENDTLTFSLLL